MYRFNAATTTADADVPSARAFSTAAVHTSSGTRTGRIGVFATSALAREVRSTHSLDTRLDRTLTDETLGSHRGRGVLASSQTLAQTGSPLAALGPLCLGHRRTPSLGVSTVCTRPVSTVKRYGEEPNSAEEATG